MFSRFSTMFNNVRSPGRGRAGGGRSGDDGCPSPAPSSSSKKRKASGDCQDYQTCQVDNSKAVISKIAVLYAERLMSDLTLVINNVEYPAHRLILCASSDVFQVMLMNPNWNEAREERVILQESQECGDIFEDFLKYLYTGRLKLELKTVLHVLVLADKYNVKDLIELCLTYMQIHIPAAAQHGQLIMWFQYTSNFGLHHNKVSECCRKYIKWNLEAVCKAEDFHHLDEELFASILADDDIVVYDEYTLYQILEFWLVNREEKTNGLYSANFLEISDHIMQFVRFPMMSPRQIADLIPNEIVRNCRSLMDNMAIAMKFHNGCLENEMNFDNSRTYYPNRLSSSRNPSYKLFTPRLYCTDQWSVLLHTPFDRIQHYQSQTLVFATPCSFSDRISSQDKQVEWCLDFHPKAVQFQTFSLIGFRGTTEMPEHILRTIRLSVICRSEEQEDVRVHIAVLLDGYQDGVEHVRKVVGRNYIFSDRERVLNMDNLLAYGELNPCAGCVTLERNSTMYDSPSSTKTIPKDILNSTSQTFLSDSSESQNEYGCSYCPGRGGKSCFFVGANQNSVKLRIVITPLP